MITFLKWWIEINLDSILMKNEFVGQKFLILTNEILKWRPIEYYK